MKIYLVGGAVRDGLLNLPVHDHDWVVVNATPEEMLLNNFLPVGKDFPVFLHPKTHEEYALARTERKTGEGYTGFSCFTSLDVTIEEDLLRRDLTINAIAFDFDEFKKAHPECITPQKALAKFKTQLAEHEHEAMQYLIDPYKGSNDIKAKTLKHVSDAFKEDPLRVLRLARFYAQFYERGFTIDNTTKQLVNLMVDNQELKVLTKERVWLETLKALNTNTPAIYFEYLQNTGALMQIYPELNLCINKESLRYLSQMSKRSQSPQLRFAALLYSLPNINTLSHLQQKKAFNAFFESLRISNDFKMVIWIACQAHHWETLLSKAANDILALFTQLNYPRQVENLYDYIEICSNITLTDSGASNTIEKLNHQKSQFLKTIHNEFEQIDTKKFIDQGLSGIEIKNALLNEKIDIIQKIQASLK